MVNTQTDLMVLPENFLKWSVQWETKVETNENTIVCVCVFA